MITVDVKLVLICALLAAATVLLVFMIVAVANLTKTLKSLNGILEDTSTVSGIIHEKAVETKPVIDDLSSAIISFSSAAKGNENRLASLSSVAKSISSLVSMIKKSK